jgi:hypothetical protein
VPLLVARKWVETRLNGKNYSCTSVPSRRSTRRPGDRLWAMTRHPFLVPFPTRSLLIPQKRLEEGHTTSDEEKGHGGCFLAPQSCTKFLGQNGSPVSLKSTKKTAWCIEQFNESSCHYGSHAFKSESCNRINPCSEATPVHRFDKENLMASVHYFSYHSFD